MKRWISALISTGFLAGTVLTVTAADNVTVQLGADGATDSLFQVTDNQTNAILRVLSDDNVTVSGKLTVTGGVDLQGAISNSTDNVTISDNLSVGEQLSVTGATTLSSVTISDNLSVTNGLSAGSINTSGNVVATGNFTTTTGTVSAGTLTTGAITHSDHIVITLPLGKQFQVKDSAGNTVFAADNNSVTAINTGDIVPNPFTFTGIATFEDTVNLDNTPRS